jgi:hypothetical protein
MYSATLGSIRKAITEQVSILELANAYNNVNAYETIYAKTLDFREQNYIVICNTLWNDAGGVHTYLRITMNGVTLATYDDVGAGGTNYSHIPIPALAKVYGLLVVEMHADGVNSARLSNLNIYLSEA